LLRTAITLVLLLTGGLQLHTVIKTNAALVTGAALSTVMSPVKDGFRLPPER